MENTRDESSQSADIQPQAQTQQAPAPRPPRGPIWFSLGAIVAGIASLVCSLTPGEPTFRTIISVIGIVLAAIGVTLAIISLRMKWQQGLSIAGVILSGFALVFGAGFLTLGLVANAQVDATIQKNNEETQARLDEEQAAQDAILEKSKWVEDAREEVEDSDFSEIDSAALAEIMADPEAHMEAGIIVNASMGEALVHEVFNSQGLCISGATLTASDEEADISQRAAILDRGTADDCPLIDRMLGLDSNESISDSLAASHRMWLVPSGMITGPDGNDLPTFLLIRVEE